VGIDNLGEECGTSSADQCAPGMTCVGVGTGSIGVCDKFCTLDSDCSGSGPGAICIIQLSDGTPTGSIPNVTLCTASCNPITNAGCPVAGTSCQLLQETAGQMRDLTDCQGAGTKTAMAACDPSLFECAPGLGCFNTGSTVCLKYCNASTGVCPGSQSCVPLATLGGISYGVCL
jgi:hypothetical protein